MIKHSSGATLYMVLLNYQLQTSQQGLKGKYDPNLEKG